MAQAKYDPTKPSTPGGPSLRPTAEKARQGQNINGMVAVLVAGTLLVTAAFAIMLALRSQPASVTNAGKDAAAAATSQSYPSTPDSSQKLPVSGNR